MLDIDRDRLGKLLGMLGSAHDGEVAAAGRAAHRLIAQAGLTWGDILTPRPFPKTPVGSLLAECRRRSAFLSDWERRFVASISSHPDRLSTKQMQCLDRIAAKIERVG